MKTKNNQRSAFMTAFLAVVFSLASIFVSGEILANDKSRSSSNVDSNNSSNSSSSSSSSSSNSNSNSSNATQNSNNDVKNNENERDRELKPEVTVEIKSGDQEEKEADSQVTEEENEEEVREPDSEDIIDSSVNNSNSGVAKKSNNSRSSSGDTTAIESKVDSAEKVEYNIVKEGSVAPKIYLGSGQRSTEDTSNETSEEATKEAEETWSLDYDFSNVPQGNYELYAEVKNKYGTYSSEGVPITVYNRANENAVRVIEKIGGENNNDKFQYVVSVMNKGSDTASEKFQEITEQENEIVNDASLTGEEKQQKIQELEKEKEEIKNQFAFRNQVEEIYKKKGQSGLTEEEVDTIQEIEDILDIDSDGDGLPDHEELRIGTDPFSADTDGDGYLDGDEVANGYNPLELAVEEGADKIIFEEPKNKGTENNLYRVKEVGLEKDDEGNGEDLLKIAGKALPNSFITLYIYSSPIVVTVKTDEDGNWSYTLDKELEDGDHQVYAAVTDNTGKITSKSKAFAFVKTAQAVTAGTENQTDLKQALSPVEEGKTKLMFFVVLISIFSLISAMASIALLYKNHKESLNN